jgi:hypothetical protein
LLFSFALKHVTVKHKVNQRGVKLNLPHQLLAFAAADNLREIITVMKETTEALSQSSMEVPLSENVDVSS